MFSFNKEREPEQAPDKKIPEPDLSKKKAGSETLVNFYQCCEASPCMAFKTLIKFDIM